MMGTRVTIEEARRVGEQIGIDWASAPSTLTSSELAWKSSWSMAPRIQRPT